LNSFALKAHNGQPFGLAEQYTQEIRAEIMQPVKTPLILYVPGLLPKPEAEVHKAALFRCLVAGVRKAEPDVAELISAQNHSFDLVSWTYDFYLKHRDIALDVAGIDAVIEQQQASDADIREASSTKRKATVWLCRLGDLVPFLIPHIASEKMEVHIRDLRRYVRNRNGIAEHTREMFKVPLRAACESGRPILLIAHSMGSVIAYDSLWEMTHGARDHARVDHLLTIGSPLGQNYLQKRLFGHDQTGKARYPDNIRRWTNLEAVGDLTAIDRVFRNDFGEMLELGLVEFIEDIALFNYFQFDGQLNVHAEYGYLANKTTGQLIADWWREHL
jgi:hypothetical protein